MRTRSSEKEDRAKQVKDRLLISVRFHEGRYHGERDGFREGGWPPSPGRLFQALVAAAARGAAIPAGEHAALRWLEELAPPRVAAPPSHRGKSVPQFVPNNDMDAVGGDPNRVADIRVGKHWRPIYFDPALPVCYIWHFDPPDVCARTICEVANGLYQLGRGIDMASATGEVVTEEQVEERLASYGVVRSPGGVGSVAVACSGTLDSLVAKYDDARRRFVTESQGTLFVQPRRARFHHVAYDAPPRRLHFELRDGPDFAPQPLRTAGVFVAAIRDAAASRLAEALPKKAQVERLIMGRNAAAQDVSRRLRIVPVPSLGTTHTDPSIRRVMVELPPEFPFVREDLKWAFTAQSAGAALAACRLVSTNDAAMADRYTRPARLFRSITAVALSRTARPTRGPLASQRRRDENQAVGAVFHALRHAGIRTRPTHVEVRRTPLQPRGQPAEAFAAGTRFPRRVMWHVELRFATDVAGPLILGDGRFLGLGLMVPVPLRDDVVGYALPSRSVARNDAPALLKSLRRALMAVARDDRGRVDRLFSGHEADGRAAGTGRHGHVFLAADVDGKWVAKLVAAAPWTVDRSTRPSARKRRLFDAVTRQLTELRAGTYGCLSLQPMPLDDDDLITAAARTWRSATPYLATRNVKKGADAAAAVTQDVFTECRRRGLPLPVTVSVARVSTGPSGGRPTADVEIAFAAAVSGPILLGRSSHQGGGLFYPSFSGHGAEDDTEVE